MTEDRFPLKYFSVFILIAIIISIVGYLLYLDREKALEEDLNSQISTIKEIKLQQIDKEQNQRKKILEAFIAIPSIRESLIKVLRKNAGNEQKQNLISWEKELTRDFGFLSVNIFDKNANLISTTDSLKSIEKNYLRVELAKILSNDSTVISNLYLRENRDLIQAIILPVYSQKERLGYLWAEVSFFEYLFPLMEYSRQIPGDIEFLLVKEESELAFVLKEVKDNGKYFIRTIPVRTQDRESVKGLLSQGEFINGVNFRGSKIFGSVKKIGGTDWVLIAKMDESQVISSIKRVATIIFLVSLLLIFLAASITYAVWKRSKLHFITRTFNLKREKDSLSERYSSLTQYANDIILSISKNGKILEANKQAVSAYGYSKEELLNMNFYDLSADMNKDQRHLLPLVDSYEGTLFESIHKNKDGKIIPVEISAKYINQYGEDLFLAIVRDNTDRKKLESDLIASKEKAEEINRLKSIFLANMSHELRTPMSGIMGYSDILLSELETGKHREMASVIHKSSKRLSETLDAILDLTKIESEKVEITLDAVEMITVIEECKSLFEKDAARKGLKLAFKHSEDKLFVKADIGIIYKILNNLIDNSVKYTKKGEIILSAETEGSDAVIRIKDTGIGIPEKFMSVIFEPFRQGSEGFNRSFEGSGLGLTITKKYIELLNGKIEIDSKVSEGTTVTVRIPKHIH